MNSCQHRILLRFYRTEPFANEKVPRKSNEIQYIEEEYLSGSGFVVNLTTPSNEFLKVKASPLWNGCDFNSKMIYNFITLLGVKTLSV